MMNNTKPIRISVMVKASKKEVWKHLLDPLSIQAWNQASEDWETTIAQVDLRVGGRFLSHMQAKDGSAGFDFEGTYTEVKVPHRYAYVLDDGRRVVVILQRCFFYTKVTFVFDPELENAIDLQKAGWQSILDSFQRFVEKR